MTQPFVFVSGPAKPAKTVSLRELRATITPENKPHAAKRVGAPTVKVFMTGAINYYTSEGPGLTSLLNRYGIHI